MAIHFNQFELILLILYIQSNNYYSFTVFSWFVSRTPSSPTPRSRSGTRASWRTAPTASSPSRSLRKSTATFSPTVTPPNLRSTCLELLTPTAMAASISASFCARWAWRRAASWSRSSNGPSPCTTLTATGTSPGRRCSRLWRLSIKWWVPAPACPPLSPCPTSLF